MATLSTLGVGGAARCFTRVTTPDEVVAANAWAVDHGMPLFVLGGGSNVVIADEGFGGLLAQMAVSGMHATQDGEDTVVTAAAGEPWDALVAFTVDRGLAGIECLSGIPGTVGGTPIQNVGAYGQEVSDVIASVSAFDRREQKMVTLGAAECGFAYRTSRFKRDDAGRFIICDVTFRLQRGQPTATYPDLLQDLASHGHARPTVADVRESVVRVRRRKGMVVDPSDPDTRSVGSFFMNPVVSRVHLDRIASSPGGDGVPHFVMQNDDVKIPAAWLIDRAGFTRGYVDGPVGLSTKHPLALINRGGATARDVLVFASRIARAVRDRFDVALRPEPVFVGFDPDDGDVRFLTR
jgi:UDP-N-acetylmuramate dehydrogenase